MQSTVALSNRVARRRTRSRSKSSFSQSALTQLGENCELLNTTRMAIVKIQGASNRSVEMLQRMLSERDATTRADNLLALEELIDIKPTHSWQDEWVEMVCEHHQTTERKVDDDCPPISTMSDSDLAAYVGARLSVEQFQSSSRFEADVLNSVRVGWTEDRAKIFQCLSYVKMPIARALRDRDPSYAAATYALCDTFFDQAAAVAEKQGPLPPQLYTHLMGPSSLTLNEPSWANILNPDATGFRGHTCSSLVMADCDPSRIDERGHKAFSVETKQLEPVDSDIVRFEPMHDDERGAHAPVLFDEDYGAFPPNTLFRLKTIIPPGEWTGPGGIKPQQKLIVVTATYRKATNANTEARNSSKLCGSTVTLNYGDRESFVRGLGEVLSRPTLTMPLEFERAFEWTDWKGVTYSLAEEWRYVNGPAVAKEGCTPGTRDAANAGKTPQDFLREVNAFILDRRAKDLGTALLDSDALLNLNEVLAVRLYSGPAYQPINTFLREVSRLTDQYQQSVARHPQLTLSSTVQHIINAIRKLAAVVDPNEAVEPLFRGVRGELPQGFWIPDKAGFICAVEMGFMSTSRNIETPVKYMDRAGHNVLWAIKPRVESDAAFHRGADVALLSQFKSEEEVLFPPNTLLLVKRREQPDGRSRQSAESSRQSAESSRPPAVLTRASSASDVHEPQPEGGGGTTDPNLSALYQQAARTQLKNTPNKGKHGSGSKLLADLTKESSNGSLPVAGITRDHSAPDDRRVRAELKFSVSEAAEPYAVAKSRKGIRYIEVEVEPSFI